MTLDPDRAPAPTDDFAPLARRLAEAGKRAARPLSTASTAQKNAMLSQLAALLVEPTEVARILAANAQDLAAGQQAGLSAALLDRLRLDTGRLAALSQAVRDIAALPDPVGEVVESWTRPRGFSVEKRRIPLGLLLLIYEARPNVTIDAAALAIKSGNAVLLRGGKEARHSNLALSQLVQTALRGQGLPEDAARFVDNPDRGLMLALLQQSGFIDLCIPRGGEALIRFVVEHARVPVIQHYQGVCHMYVDADADLDMAVALIENAKCSRPGVCNALECLLIHEAQAAALLPALAPRLARYGVELRLPPAAMALLPSPIPDGLRPRPVTADDYGREFLDQILAVRIVPSLDAAIAHIADYGSLHSEVIVTQNASAAARFQREVCASFVGWNLSTRFNDGGELGLGAEVGISTSKLHAFGPMGLRELCSTKFVATGTGQVRG
ncbi:MAG TPA: glutamate-5-semialdehyde dehydrogenase [Pseudomonadota bacterium]|nr:glutamate-5-semialdehyde dehydrogenase [Pseudomonadota bacterium]